MTDDVNRKTVMNQDPSQSESPESGLPATGSDWNNGISRRSFLKKTGGATVATMVTWHGMKLNAEEDPPQAQVPLKMVVVIPSGSTMYLDSPDANPQNDVTLSNFTTMNSGDSLTEWAFSSSGQQTMEIEPGTGRVFVNGPATWTFTREKN